MDLKELLRDHFRKNFGGDEGLVFGRAPGRVNLIGEHTDYNDGFVFPMAIDFQIMLAARRRSDRLVRIYSVDYEDAVEFSLDQTIDFDNDHRWSNYPRGVLRAMQEAGAELCGLEMAFCGDIPQGSGLSSSAALEVVTAKVAQNLTGFSMEAPALAKLCQKAENDFVGMKCGIMDQFISMMGREDHALFLDCRSLEYQHIPLNLGDYRIIICHSGVKHSLVDSEYNKRRRECEEGVRVLQSSHLEIKALRDVDVEQLKAGREEMDPVVYNRCLHVISENNRVEESIRALKAGDLPTFGRLLNGSHDSLRDLYEVSCPEVDLLVDLAREVDGVLGARITGGGFGGCTVNLVASAAVNDFSRHVLENYKRKTGIEARIFVSRAARGAEILK